LILKRGRRNIFRSVGSEKSGPLKIRGKPGLFSALISCGGKPAGSNDHKRFYARDGDGSTHWRAVPAGKMARGA